MPKFPLQSQSINRIGKQKTVLQYELLNEEAQLYTEKSLHSIFFTHRQTFIKDLFFAGRLLNVKVL